MTEATDQDRDNDNNSDWAAKAVYVLYLGGLVLWLTGVIGVAVAYVNRADSADWLKTHYQFQIRTFWIGFLYLLIGGLLSGVGIGWLILGFWVVWLIVRCVLGLKYVSRSQPHPNPTTWWFR